MKTKLQATKIFLSILVILILSCAPVTELIGTPDNSGGGSDGQPGDSQPVGQPDEIISPDNAKNLVEISTFGKGSGHYPTYSPDGTLLAVSSSSGIYLYDSQTLQENMYFAQVSVLDMAFSPDGKILSVFSNHADLTSTVIQWDVANGSELHSSSLDTSRDQDAAYELVAAFSPDGKALAVTFDENTVKVWDAASGQELRSLSAPYAGYLTFSPDSKTLASAYNGTVTLFDVSSGNQLRTFATSQEFISLAFSPDGKTLAVGDSSAFFGADIETTLWDVASGSELLRIKTPLTVPIPSPDIVFIYAFSPDGKTLASGSADAIKVWDTASGTELLTWSASNVERLAFSPDGKTLVSASSIGDDSVKMWDAATAELLNTLKGDDMDSEVIFSPDGATLAYASSDNVVRLRDVASGEVRILGGHPDYVTNIVFSPDGKTLASSSDFFDFLSAPDNILKLWDVVSGSELHTLNEHSFGGVLSVAFSPDSKTLASTSSDNTIKLWDVANGSELLTLSGTGTGSAYGVAFSPDGKMLASAFTDQAGDEVKLWDVANSTELLTLSVNTDSGLSVAFSPDGKALVSSDYYGYGLRQMWEVGSGQELPAFGDSDAQRSFAFSPDGKTLATGLEDGTVKLWDIVSGDELYTLSGHTGKVRSVVFSADGKILISGGGDQIKVWEVGNGQELASLSLSNVLNLVLSPDGKLILARSPRGMSLWGVSP